MLLRTWAATAAAEVARLLQSLTIVTDLSRSALSTQASGAA
jgi:hypothetical protein